MIHPSPNVFFSTTPLHVILVGPPGCGKGTLSNWFETEKNMKCISTGELLRTITLKPNLNPQEKTLSESMKNGTLIDDETIGSLLFENLNFDSSFLLDGYPRTLNQAKILLDNTKKQNIKPLVLELVCDEEILFKRLAGRLLHPGSSRSYNLFGRLPKNFTTDEKSGEKIWLDDETGDRLIQREDDKPEIVRARLQSFFQDSKPAIDYMVKNPDLVTVYKIDASTAARAVAATEKILECTL